MPTLSFSVPFQLLCKDGSPTLAPDREITPPPSNPDVHLQPFLLESTPFSMLCDFFVINDTFPGSLPSPPRFTIVSSLFWPLYFHHFVFRGEVVPAFPGHLKSPFVIISMSPILAVVRKSS